MSSNRKIQSKWDFKHTRTMGNIRRAPSKKKMKTYSSQRAVLGVTKMTKPKHTIIGTFEACSNETS